MNFKRTLTALAVAGVIATPMAAQADLYASARIGLINTDTGGLSQMEVNGVASRMGAKSETDLGNGMTGFGKYEYSVNVDGGAPTLGLRHGLVGLKGDFGSVTLGQTYHTFYNYVVGPMDNPWRGSGFAQVAYVGRTPDAISYAGGSGGVSFGATAYMVEDANEDALDGTELGASFGVGGMTLALAMKDAEVFDDAIVGLALTGIDLGGASLGVGFQSQGDDSSFLVDAAIGNAYVHIELNSPDVGAEDSLTTVGYTQSLGRKTTAYYEFYSYDADSGNSDDDETSIAAVLKYDIE